MLSKLRHVGRARKLLAENSGHGVILQDQPGGFGPLLVIERVLASSDFAPARYTLAHGLDQDDVAVAGAPEAGLKNMQEGHANLPEDDSVDFHPHCPNR